MSAGMHEPWFTPAPRYPSHGFTYGASQGTGHLYVPLCGLKVNHPLLTQLLKEERISGHVQGGEKEEKGRWQTQTYEASSPLLPLQRYRKGSPSHSAKHFPINPLCVFLSYFSKRRAMPTWQESMGKKNLFPLWHSMIPLSSLKRFWSEQQSQTFLINSLIHFERMDWSCFFNFSPGKKKNLSQHNSPLNGPCLTRTSAAGSRWGASQNPEESPAHLTCFLWVSPFYPERHSKHLPVLSFMDL